MERLLISALSLESAEGFRSGLAEFQTELTESANGHYQVEIMLDGDRQIVTVLNALVEYVTNRGDGPARLELDGRRYTLGPQPGFNEPSVEYRENEPEQQPEAAGDDG